MLELGAINHSCNNSWFDQYVWYLMKEVQDVLSLTFYEIRIGKSVHVYNFCTRESCYTNWHVIMVLINIQTMYHYIFGT